MDNKPYVTFAIPLDATADVVEDVIGAIKDTFNYAPPGEVDPPGPTNPPGTVAQMPNVGTTTAAAADLDTTGLPWDARIHSSAKTKTEDGKWRAKRGVDDATRKKIENTLRTSLASATPAASTAAPAGLPPLPGAAAPAGLPPLPGAAAPDPTAQKFAELIQLIGSNTKSDTNPGGRLTPEWVKQVLEYFGVADGNVQTIAALPDKIEEVRAYIAQQLGG